jgi:hypothetical protein
MIMKDGVRMGVAIGLGYLLGRTRKMRLALMLAGAGATGRFGKSSTALIKQGTDVLGSSPEVKTLAETVRGRLVEAGKAAALTAVSSRVDALSEKIEEGTRSLSEPPVPGQKEEEPEEREQEQGGETPRRRPRHTTTPRRRRRADADTDEDLGDTDEEPDAPPEDERRDERHAGGRQRRPARPSSRRPPVRRTRGRDQ